MGIIIRQSLKQSIISYAAILIGAIGTILVYPNALEAYGLVQFILNTALITVPIVLFGMTNTAVKFFPRFENKTNGHNGLLPFLLIVLLINLLLILGIFLFFEDLLMDFFTQKSKSLEAAKLNKQYFKFVIPLIFLYSLDSLLQSYIRNFHRIVFPAIFGNLLPKVFLIMIILLFIMGWISLPMVMYGLLMMMSFAVIGHLLYLHHLGELMLKPNFSFLKKNLLKEIGNFSLFSSLSSWGTILATRIDIVMLGSFTSHAITGSYAIILFITDVVNVPRNAIAQIATPIISKAWNDGNHTEIETLYKKSALNQLIFGLIIYLCIITSISELFSFMGNKDILLMGLNAVTILGAARIIDLGTGINDQIIWFSPFYKLHMYTVIILAVINIGFNTYLIPIYGMTGAALATLISIIIFNTTKLAIIYSKQKIHPFSKGTLITLSIGLLSYYLSIILPDTTYNLLNLVYKPAVVGLFYIILIYLTKTSSDFNSIINSFMEKISKV